MYYLQPESMGVTSKAMLLQNNDMHRDFIQLPIHIHIEVGLVLSMLSSR